MATILPNFGSGGSPMTPTGNSGVTLATALRDVADDLDTIKTWANTLAAKLNADAGVTDTNYATIGTLKTLKG